MNESKIDCVESISISNLNLKMNTKRSENDRTRARTKIENRFENKLTKCVRVCQTGTTKRQREREREREQKAKKCNLNGLTGRERVGERAGENQRGRE